MQIEVTEQDGVHVMALDGSLETTSSPEVEARLGELIQGGASKIAVDLAKVDFVSSAGLRVLLVAAKLQRRAGGKICVCGLNVIVQEVFDISGFSTIVAVQPDRETALASF